MVSKSSSRKNTKSVSKKRTISKPVRNSSKNSSSKKSSSKKSSSQRIVSSTSLKSSVPLNSSIPSNSSSSLKSSNVSSIYSTFKDTSQIPVSDRLIGQVIGQENSVEIIRKAAAQKRNVLLVGIPGTGKSMLAQAMSEILPVQKLNDVLIYANDEDPNNPKVSVVKAGEGKRILNALRLDARKEDDNARLISFMLPLGWFVLSGIIWQMGWISDVIFAANILLGGVLLVALALGSQMKTKETKQVPKLLINNFDKKLAPFFEGTGSRSGALLGDVRHDPLQSGGLGTPPHLRIEPGMIHKASGGVLFIDEIATLSYKSQQELLTAMQEKKYAITGQSELSSGAMTRTDPVPCDFVLVAAGNYGDLEKVHPALRSRIRGYGYEVFMNVDMIDNEENRNRIVQFIAQEVTKDKKIPHFSREAVDLIIFEAKQRAGRKGRLTLKLRDLGGLIRGAGDIAIAKNHAIVLSEDIFEAKISARTLEQQMIDKSIEMKRDYDVYLSSGSAIGRVNGLAVSGDGSAGMILPIEAEIAPASSKSEGRIIATGKLGEIAKEAVQNVSALIKKISGEDINKKDLHIQFLQTYEGVEGDSASISVATAVISSLEGIPIKQSLAMTGSLSVRGEVLPVGGITSKVSAAIKAGFKEVIIPKSNLADVVLSDEDLAKIKIIPVSSLDQVLSHAFVSSSKTKSFLSTLKKVITYSLSSVLKSVSEPLKK